MLKNLIYLLLPLGLLAQNQTLTFSKGTYQECYRPQETITLDGLTFNLASQELTVINDTAGIDEDHEEGDGIRWLSLDPLAAKYPSISPYVFVNNNPIIYIDPDGRDWTITTTKNKNGDENIHINLKAAVLNSTSNSYDIVGFAFATVSQTMNTYTTQYTKNIYKTIMVPSGLDNVPPHPIQKLIKVISVNVTVTVDVRVIEDKKQLAPDEHLIEVQKQEELIGLNGRSDMNGTHVEINENMMKSILSGVNTSTLAHELGHTLGLDHPDKAFEETQIDHWTNGGNPQYKKDALEGDNKQNVMISGKKRNLTTGNKVNKDQIELIKTNENLNQE